MKDILQKIVNENNDLYSAIDKCIYDIVLSRLHNKKEDEARAIFYMQTLMNATLQHLCWVNQELEKILEENGNA